MKINRHRLIADLTSFACAGNGLVIGPPGVGKSYALADLREVLKQSGITHLIIPVESLGQATDADVKALLRRDGDFVELLRSAVSDRTRPAILIFDGFDAARSEADRAGVFQLIRRAVTELKGQWHTIVSVRTFDAKKSRRLLQYFPWRDETGRTDSLSCRHFVIPQLTDEELAQAFDQIAGLRQLNSGGTKEFQTLLTNPFNLWLVEKVLNAGAHSEEFSHITSEVQLLEMYWKHRVRDVPNPEIREFILKQTAQTMVNDNTLMARRDKVYHPSMQAAWESLLSDEILYEVPEREAHIAFTHNILFDFAASVYLLEPEPKKFAQFVAGDVARPLFLRPSLVYHFTRLWHFDRDSFWRNFWTIVQREEINLRQIIRIALPAVVVNEAQTAKDLQPFLQRLIGKEPFANEAVALLLQALRVLQSQKGDLWGEFIEAAGQHLNPKFAWDAGILATRILDANEKASPETISKIGNFGRSLLFWAWNSRSEKEKGAWFDRLAAFVAIPLVAKTYHTDKDAARRLLKAVVDVVGTPNFPIDCIYCLTNEIGHLVSHDPDFVGIVYERVFAYQEESTEATTKGGPVLSFSMTRRDDYGMCRYSLIKAFPQFLAANPAAALRCGLRAVQAYVIRDHLVGYLKNGTNHKTLVDLIEKFPLRGSTASYIEDRSAIWDQTEYPDQELEIADQIFSWISEASKREDSEKIKLFLSVFQSEAKLAFLWSRLLRVAAIATVNLAPELWELAKSNPVLTGNDCLLTLGSFLEKASGQFTKDERAEIESAILAIANEDVSENTPHLTHRRDRLIARIPKDLLVSPAALALRHSLETTSGLPPNTPIFKISSGFRSYSEEDFLREQGANTQSPANRKICELFKPLKEWNEKNKDESTVDSLLPTVSALREALRTIDADESVVSAGWTHLAGFASDALLRTETAESERFKILRSIVLEASVHPEPIPDPHYDKNWSSATWSPKPRNDAAEALPWLTHFGVDKQVITAIQKLATDPVPSVRFLLMCEIWRLLENCPEVMWEILDELADKESNGVVLQGITVSLWQLISRAKERSLPLIAKLLERTGDDADNEEKAQSHLVSMVTDYAVWDHNTWALQTIAAWRSEPVKKAAQLAVSGRRLVEYLAPGQPAVNLKRAGDLLLMHLEVAAQGLALLQNDSAKVSKDEVQAKWRMLYGIIDSAVTRIYFAADIDPNLRERKEHPLDDSTRHGFFLDVKPVLEKILELSKAPKTGTLLAPTAHHFMELLNGVLPYDPPLVLRIAADVVTCSQRYNYNLDSMAMGQVVKLVESILTDYRDKVQGEESITRLLELLDAFVAAGWPEALNLVWRLDEIYR